MIDSVEFLQKLSKLGSIDMCLVDLDKFLLGFMINFYLYY